MLITTRSNIHSCTFLPVRRGERRLYTSHRALPLSRTQRKELHSQVTSIWTLEVLVAVISRLPSGIVAWSSKIKKPKENLRELASKRESVGMIITSTCESHLRIPREPLDLSRKKILTKSDKHSKSGCVLLPSLAHILAFYSLTFCVLLLELDL
jgi:hypothetical protein